MRFAFGKNWLSFLSVLDQRHIDESVRSLQECLGNISLVGWRALDIGSGSGLSSLAMRRMGARVVSFDYDPDSVACTMELRARFDAGTADWEVLQGSVLDPNFMTSLGEFDLVYAWGVLHHTGAMWDALDLARRRVAPGGTLVVAIYNDQGWRSRFWRSIKKLYCSGRLGRMTVTTIFYPLFFLHAIALDLRALHLPGRHARDYVKRRGMSLLHDWRDWLGGYPFETATPQDVETTLSAAGFSLIRSKLTRGWGCNEFVLRRTL